MLNYVRAFALGCWLTSTAITLNALQLSSIFFVFPFSKNAFHKFNSYCANIIWSCMQSVFEVFHSAKITFSGHTLPEGENAVIISNHVAFADIYMIHGLAMRKKMLHACRYFAKDSLKWMPGFGWGIWLMGMIMIKRNWSSDQSLIKSAFKSLIALKSPIWLISFPEGTRQTKDKLQRSQKYASEKGFPVLSHVLLPRTKGFIATLQGLSKSHVKAIYDLTLVYFHVPSRTIQLAPNMLKIHSGPLNDYRFHIHVKRYDIEEVPKDEKKCGDWLLKRFAEKDEFIKQMEQTLNDDLSPKTKAV